MISNGSYCLRRGLSVHKNIFVCHNRDSVRQAPPCSGSTYVFVFTRIDLA
jgi:hypothetical protein